MRAAPRTLFFRLLVLTLPVEFLVLALFGVWLVHRTERRDLAAFDDRLRIQTQAMLSGVGLDPEGRLRVDADLNGRALAPGGRAVVLDQRGLILWESPPGWFEAGGIAPYSQQVQEYLRTLRVRGAVFRILDSATRVRRPQDGDEPTGPLVEAIVAQPLSGLIEGQAVFRERAMAVGLLLLALTAALLWVAIRAGLSPIRAMERRLQAVPGPAGRERLDEALVPEELRPLAREINGLLDRVWELVQREKRFAAEAAHELRTPLTLVKSTLQTALLTSGSREEGERALQEALEDLQRLEETAESLLTLARADALLPEGPRRLEEVSLPELLGSLAERYAAAASAKGQTIALELDAASIRGDRAALERLFGNLLDNAVKYGGGGPSRSGAGRPRGRSWRPWRTAARPSRLTTAPTCSGSSSGERPRARRTFAAPGWASPSPRPWRACTGPKSPGSGAARRGTASRSGSPPRHGADRIRASPSYLGLLAPVARPPDPSAAEPAPAPVHPDGPAMRSGRPAPGHPRVAAGAPGPVAAHPDVGRSRAGRGHFRAGQGRRDANDDGRCDHRHAAGRRGLHAPRQ